MAELDQHRPTTSTYHRPTMEESVTKLKRLQRFTRQFSIFVHCEEEKLAKIASESPVAKEDENNEDRLFKYPGNVRAVKRKRNISNSSPTKSIVAKRKMMGHQQSIREDPEEQTSGSPKSKIEKEPLTQKEGQQKEQDAEEPSK